ncbi:hypothetical protein B0I35DRAFT_401904 [Stachybotrys elegans]|uniref:Rhodopsin domain-containing protein n=1 Tax=Stachybotrys elegans TaxID=80388 RepID=A0A8K0WJU1_9HYPO|nr:hypothetical protein B0I35DRAFT_401904 [Stachybotrys elegans]
MKQFGMDDLFIVVAMCLALAFCGSMYMYILTAYIGIHVWDIPPGADPQPSFIWGFVNMCLYNPILALVKSSVLFFLLRIASTKTGVRYAVYGLNAFNLAMMVATFLVVVFQCRPISGAWDLVDMQTAECIDPLTFTMSTAVITIITDLLVLAIPFWIIIGLKMPSKVKLSLIGVFFLGILVTVVSCIRLRVLMVVLDPDPNHPDPDPTYGFGACLESIEGNLAILTASIPALWPLIRQWFPRFISRLNSSYRNGSSGWTGADEPSRRQTFKMKSMRSTHHRSEIRSKSPSGSEEEIMTYNGILRTTAVTVQNESSNASDYDHGHNKEPRTTEYTYSVG